MTGDRRLWTLSSIGVVSAGVLITAFVLTRRPHMRAEVYAWYPNGVVARVSPAEGDYYQSCVRPDGTSVIFSGGEEGPPRIWKATLPSGEVVPLTPPDSAAFLPSFSWDGSKIVFSSDRAFDEPSIALQDAEDPRIYRRATLGKNKRNFNLFVMDADGGNVRQITTGAQRDLRGAFSPDGDQVVYYSRQKGLGALWVVPIDLSRPPERLTLVGAEQWHPYRPWYTRDGAHLYFFARQNTLDRKRVYRVAAAGGVPEPIPWDDRGKSQAPFVDPSGDYLLFHSDRTGQSELWEMPLAGGEPRMLEPPRLTVPADRQVMHPTRSRDGIVTFDASFTPGPR